MHTLTFEMKRAHLASIRLTRKLCALVGLTPARLDMVRAIFADSNRIRQSELRHHLGVSKAVVSIMIRALEKLGFVRRTKCHDDRRTFDLVVLAKGRIALRRIHYESRTERFLDMAFDQAFRPEHPRPRVELHALEYALRRFRTEFGLPSHDEKPWEWNDDDPPFYYGAYTDNLAMVDLAPDEDWEGELEDDELAFVTDDDRCPVFDPPRPITKLRAFSFEHWAHFQQPAAALGARDFTHPVVQR